MNLMGGMLPTSNLRLMGALGKEFYKSFPSSLPLTNSPQVVVTKSDSSLSRWAASLFSFSSSLPSLFSGVFNHFMFPITVLLLEFPFSQEPQNYDISYLSSLLNLIRNIHLSSSRSDSRSQSSLLMAYSLFPPFSLLFHTPHHHCLFPTKQFGIPPIPSKIQAFLCKIG